MIFSLSDTVNSEWRANEGKWGKLSNLRFGCVHWWVSVTNILCALENSESQWGEEVSWSQQASGWSQSKTGVAAQEIVHLLQLWNSILDKDSFFLKLSKDNVVFTTSMLRHQVFDNAEHWTPSVMFNLSVFDARNWIATVEMKVIFRIRIDESSRGNLLLVSKSNFSNVLSTWSVFLVGESRMVHVQIGFVLGHQMVATVEFWSMLREPWSSDANVVFR